MPTKGTPKQTIRVDPDLWRRFGEAVGDRAAALRAFMAWSLREPGAKLPKRSAPPTTVDQREFQPLRHEFEPYQWDVERCGFVDGDDMMCGYDGQAHASSQAKTD